MTAFDPGATTPAGHGPPKDPPKLTPVQVTVLRSIAEKTFRRRRNAPLLQESGLVYSMVQAGLVTIEGNSLAITELGLAAYRAVRPRAEKG